MISGNKKWNLELELTEGFVIFVKDAYSVSVRGDFDKDEILYQVSEYFPPEDVYQNGELEKWAEENGYLLEEE
jgi:hypothetical protein